MPDLTRQQLAADADPLVVKVGTRCLARSDGSLDEAQIEAIAEQLVRIGAGRFRKVVLVSSGAVGAGIGRLGLSERPTDLAGLQAAAAVGQSCVIEAYHRAFQRYGMSAAQLLLTIDDINDRRRYLNVRNALASLFEFGAIPVVNENDTVRTDELARNVGDNDRLAAMVTNLVRAPLLIMLTDVEGLYDGDPRDADSQLIGMIDDVDQTTESMVAEGTHSGSLMLSKGGMASKLRAAQIATAAGENVILANGRRPGVLIDILAGEPIGTLLPGAGQRVGERKRWIGFAAQPLGTLILDDGAVRAVADRGGSLLPIGVTQITGTFDKGDLVSLVGRSGEEVARGLTNYSSTDLARIIGQPSEAIAEVLGRMPYRVVVHRNDMTLVQSQQES